MFGKTTDSTLAIDLAADAVRVLDVRIRKNTPYISTFASQSVTAGTLDTLPERQLSSLAGLLATHRLKTRRCVAAMPTQLVFTRALAIDSSKGGTDEEQILKLLANCVPFDARDLIFDYWPVSDSEAPNAKREFLVVATQASVVQRYLAGLEKLKLTCRHMDVAPCAIASLVSRAAAARGSLVGTVTLGDSAGYFALLEQDRVLFWRPFELPSGTGQKIASAQVPVLERIGDEISKCVSHMIGSMHVEPLVELLVFGHGADDAGFAEYLKHRFHLAVRTISPFECLPAESMPADVRTAVKPNVATHFAAAVGLAMQPTGVAAHG